MTTNSSDSKASDSATSDTELIQPERSPAPDGQPVGGETWVALCAQAAVEQDPKRLLELVSEINRLLDVRKKRLGQEVNGRGTK